MAVRSWLREKKVGWGWEQEKVIRGAQDNRDTKHGHRSGPEAKDTDPANVREVKSVARALGLFKGRTSMGLLVLDGQGERSRRKSCVRLE